MSEVSINEAVLRTAILNIYSDLNIPETGRLTLEHLESEWEETGLRLDDLVRGVQGLIAEGDLTLQTVEGQRCLQLTDQGYHNMTAPPSAATMRIKMQVSRAISHAQKRKKAGESAAAAISRGDEDLKHRLRVLPDSQH